MPFSYVQYQQSTLDAFVSVHSTKLIWACSLYTRKRLSSAKNPMVEASRSYIIL